MDSGAPLDSATVSIARIAQTGRPGRPAAGIIARRSILATLALLAALLLALAGAWAALAHAELVASDPADGEVLDASPTTIRLAFSENLDPAKSSFRLLGPDGAAIGTGDATAAKAMSLQPPPLSDGTYTIKWTSASADDGDIERGQFDLHGPARGRVAAAVRPAVGVDGPVGIRARLDRAIDRTRRPPPPPSRRHRRRPPRRPRRPPRPRTSCSRS